MGDVIWQKEFDTGESNEVAYGVAVDSSNNIIIVGYDDATIVKYDPNGNKLWNQEVSSNQLVTVATDSSNNIIVGGSGGISKFGTNGGTAIWYDTPGSVQDIAVDSNDNIIVILSDKLYKYKPVGEFVWAPKNFNNFKGVSVAVDSNNNIIVAGYEEGSDTSFKVVKFDSNGELIWSKTYGTTNDGLYEQAYGVTVDPNDNIIATGFSGNDMITIKYSSSGSQLWTKKYKEGNYDTIGQGIVTDSNENIFVASFFSDDLNQDNWLVLKYDSNGNLGWKSVNPGGFKGSAYDITADSNNNIIATGYGWKESPTYKDFFNTVKYKAEMKKKSLPIAKILEILKLNKNK
jgi:hypothetical protein